MKLKTVDISGTTYAEVRDGQPVYVHADGKEVGFDAPHAIGKIKTLSDERDTLRTKATELETAAKAFDGLDAAKAREALATVANLDAKKLIDAGKVDDLVRERLKDAATTLAEKEKAWGAERGAFEAQVVAAQQQVRKHLISTRFASSKALEPTVLPPDVAESMWGRNFDVEGDVVVGKIGDSKIYSRAKPGELADFDEALGILIDQYPNKERILRGSGSSGAGASGSNGRAPSANRSAMTPAQKAAFINQHGSEAYLALPAS